MVDWMHCLLVLVVRVNKVWPNLPPLCAILRCSQSRFHHHMEWTNWRKTLRNRDRMEERISKIIKFSKLRIWRRPRPPVSSSSSPPLGEAKAKTKGPKTASSKTWGITQDSSKREKTSLICRFQTIRALSSTPIQIRTTRLSPSQASGSRSASPKMTTRPSTTKTIREETRSS